MKIEWDPKKARANLKKHKVSFEEAATAMSDSMAVTGADSGHSMTEGQYITFGISERGGLLVVAHTEEGGPRSGTQTSRKRGRLLRGISFRVNGKASTWPDGF